MNREQGLAMLEETRTIAIVRGVDRADILQVAHALWEGGIRVMEVTLNTVGAYYMIKDLRKEFGSRLMVGAGTVLDTKDAKAAQEAGASFFVMPHTDKRVIGFANDENIPVFPGAMTPTEIVKAWKAGATAVKLFPHASQGIGFIQELMGPLGHIPMLAVGGVNEHNAADYIRAGCRGIGVGSSIIDQESIRQKQFDQVSERASRLMAAVQSAIRELKESSSLQ